MTLDQERNEQLVEQIARQISRWRMAVPSLLLLEIARPFSFIAGQSLLLCQPLMGIFDKGAETDRYVGFLSDRTNIDRLIQRLENDIAHNEKRGPKED